MAACSSAHTAESPTVTLSDRFKGKWFGRQLAETVDEFLQRLPPATTEGSEELKWIWISNPYLPLRQYNSAEIPGDEESTGISKVSLMTTQGQSMLHELEKKQLDMLRNLTQQSAAAISREISIERDKTVVNIQNLAIEMKITTGKVSKI
jgi:hypothetical protein